MFNIINVITFVVTHFWYDYIKGLFAKIDNSKKIMFFMMLYLYNFFSNYYLKPNLAAV